MMHEPTRRGRTTNMLTLVDSSASVAQLHHGGPLIPTSKTMEKSNPITYYDYQSIIWLVAASQDYAGQSHHLQICFKSQIIETTTTSKHHRNHESLLIPQCCFSKSIPHYPIEIPIFIHYLSIIYPLLSPRVNHHHRNVLIPQCCLSIIIP